MKKELERLQTFVHLKTKLVLIMELLTTSAIIQKMIMLNYS